ncbi:threonine/serine exporter family protein [Ruminococcus sp. OA3]|uniref:threonine/serine exporter family protein n=1 Tax=Ruminococcus sp. OA3 TaxID=2914164 RepID=UPI001F06D736|nr:threonine/serine exporter family protein [Ruminococcus sp. OA3]MCH1981729.1 threonine/serine exporter family protein [Ruminococcus sp. OA3]
MLLQSIYALAAVTAFCVLLEVPKKQVMPAGIAGAICWASYLFVWNLTGSTVFSSFLSACVVSVYSRIMARFRRAPVTVFFIPGILPIVPGVAMYRSVYYLMTDNDLLAKEYLLEALLIAGAIAFSVFLTDSVGTLLEGSHTAGDKDIK